MDALKKHLVSVALESGFSYWHDIRFADDFYELWYGEPILPTPAYTVAFRKEFPLTPDGFEDYRYRRETEKMEEGA